MHYLIRVLELGDDPAYFSSKLDLAFNWLNAEINIEHWRMVQDPCNVYFEIYNNPEHAALFKLKFGI